MYFERLLVKLANLQSDAFKEMLFNEQLLHMRM